MKKFSIVHFRNDHITLLDVVKSKKGFTLFPPIKVEEGVPLSKYFSTRTKILTYFSPLETIEESITLPSVIKNEATILKALSVKLHNERLINEPLVLNKLYTLADQTGESTHHYYEGLYEREIYDTIAPLTQWEHIDRISSEVYALFAISEEIFPNKSYLSVYTQNDRNLIIAVSKGVLLFNRIGELQSIDEIERVKEQISDINQTAAYVRQQYREENFEFIAISGNILDSEMATIQLQTMTGLRVCVLAPTLMVKGLQLHNAQEFILDIGMLYLSEKMNFLPERIKALKEFNIGTKIILSVALLILLIGMLFSFNAYLEYKSERADYHNTRLQLEQTLRNAVTLDDHQLESIIAILRGSTEMDTHFLDSMITLNKLFELASPSDVLYTHNTKGGVLDLHFSKKCTTLRELYLFEKSFKQKIDSLEPQKLPLTPSCPVSPRYGCKLF